MYVLNTFQYNIIIIRSNKQSFDCLKNNIKYIFAT